MKRLYCPVTRIIFTVFLGLILLAAGFSFSTLSAQTPEGTPSPTESPSPTLTPGPTTAPGPDVSPSPESPVPTGSPSPSPVDPGTPPPEVTEFAADWPLANKDYANTRATTDSSINSGNIQNLGAVWIHDVPAGLSTFGSISTNPIIMGDTVFIQDMGNNVFALDLATGELKWQTVYNVASTGPNGVAVAYGKVFISINPYEVAALDSETGGELWRTTLIDIQEDPSQGVNGIDIQLQAYNNLVYVSTVPGNPGVFYAGGGMGILYALDQETGEIVWEFNTIEPPSWVTDNAAINSGGGCWYSPAIDTETGIMYWSIANPAPFPGQPQVPGIDRDWPNGSSRPGPNLYTNSLIAMNHATGEMKWFTQVWPHDISDYDLQCPPILAEADFGGRQQEIVISAGKMGQVYAFNRETGALIWQVAVGEHNGNDLLAEYPLDETITVIPGILGGVETPMAYADGVVYVLANNLATDFTNGLTLELHPFSENTSDLVAIDVNLGRVRWNVSLPSGGYGGATVVNDLVFTGTFDGMLYAFNKETGEQVWSYQAPAGVNSFPAITGDTIVWPTAGAGIPSVLGFRLASAEPEPRVHIVTPDENASLPAGAVTVTAVPSNFTLSPQNGENGAPAGDGHIIYYLDVEPPATPGQPATTEEGTYQISDSTSFTWENVPPGEHTLAVQLVNADDTSLDPPVIDRVTITTDTNPRVTIVSPGNGDVMRAGPITVMVEVTNFGGLAAPSPTATPSPSPTGTPTPDGSPAPGGSPTPDGGTPIPSPAAEASPSPAPASPTPGGEIQGRIIYYLDVEPPTTPGQPATTAEGTFQISDSTSFTWENVPTGTHVFYVQLVDENNMPLSEPVVAQSQIFVIEFTGGLGMQ